MNIKIKCHFNQTIRLASKNIQDSSGNWQSRIISISPLSRSIGQDKTYEVSGLDIEFSDHDKYFRTFMNGPNRAIAGQKVEILTESNETVYIGTVQKWAWGLDTFRLNINDQLAGLTKSIPPHFISRNEYSAVPDEAAGVPIPIIYGFIESTHGAIKAWKVENDLYLVADHHCYAFGSVFDPEKNQITSGFSMLNDTDGRCYLEFNTGQGTHDYYCLNVHGIEWSSGSGAIRHPLYALKHFLGNYTELEHEGITSTEIREIFEERNYKIDYAITREMKVHEVLSDFCISFDCDFLMTNGGKIKLKIMDLQNIQGQVEKEFRACQIIEMSLDEDPETIKNKIKYMYKYNYVGDYFQHLPVFQNDASAEMWGVYYDTLPLRMVKDETIAFDVVQRHCIQKKNPKRTASACFPLAEFAGLDVGSIIKVEHPVHISTQSRIYKIESYSINFETDTVDVQMIDINTLSGAFFILGDETLPGKWTNADDSSRQYAYLANTTGYFSTGEPGKVLS